MIVGTYDQYLVTSTHDHVIARSSLVEADQGDAGQDERAAAEPDRGALSSPRHRSLRAAIGRSHQLCAPAECLQGARLSVFQEVLPDAGHDPRLWRQNRGDT